MANESSVSEESSTASALVLKRFLSITLMSVGRVGLVRGLRGLWVVLGGDRRSLWMGVKAGWVGGWVGG